MRLIGLGGYRNVLRAALQDMMISDEGHARRSTSRNDPLNRGKGWRLVRISLTEKGGRQADSVANRLREMIGSDYPAITSSDLERAKESERARCRT